jgi:hypothetical protein
MASKLNYSTALRGSKLAAITTAVGNAGTLKIYDNSAAQPAGPDTAVPGGSVLLANFTLGSPFGPAASAGVLSPTLPANVNGSATGTQTWFRISTSGATACVDGSAGTSGCDLNLSGTIVSGQPVSITSWTITDNNFGH